MLKPKGVSVYKPSVWFAVIYVIWKKRVLYFIILFSLLWSFFFGPWVETFSNYFLKTALCCQQGQRTFQPCFCKMNQNTNNTRFINWDTFTLFGETKLEVLLLSGRPLHGKPRTLRYLVMISQELLLTFKRLGKDFYFPKVFSIIHSCIKFPCPLVQSWEILLKLTLSSILK